MSEQLNRIRNCREKVAECLYIPEIMGYEGQGAKAYFDGLSGLIDPEFVFHGRNKRPPRDEFNSMISLGYSILLNEIYGKIEAKGLNPYFGFLHRDNEKHPTLASDMMEEWRAVIVDATVMSMINGHEIQKVDFVKDAEEPGCYLTKNGIKIYLTKLSKLLLGYGFRIQKSAFEAIITKRKYKELLERLPAFAGEEDSIRIYKIVGKGQVITFGKEAEETVEDVVVI